MIKYELLPQQLLYEGTVENHHFFEPDQLTRDEILLTHSEEYLDKLESQTISEKEVRKIGFPMRMDLIERGKHIAKGTYLCALHALQHQIAFNIAGGTHHSFANHGEGFCIFNDIAIASNLLLHRKEVSKILVVDLDVHQGNGTAAIFNQDLRVFTFSMHGAKNYPTKKEMSNLDIGLPDGTTDDLYLETLYHTIPELINQQKPDIIFYLSGVDIIQTDKLGRLSVSIEGCKKRDEFVLHQAKTNQIPIVCVMGGGYSPSIKDIIEAHANTYRVAMDIYS